MTERKTKKTLALLLALAIALSLLPLGGLAAEEDPAEAYPLRQESAAQAADPGEEPDPAGGAAPADDPAPAEEPVPAEDPESAEGAEPGEDPESMEEAEPGEEPEPMEEAEPGKDPEPMEEAEPGEDPEPMEEAEPGEDPEPMEEAEPGEDPAPVEETIPEDEPESAVLPDPTGDIAPAEDTEPEEELELVRAPDDGQDLFADYVDSQFLTGGIVVSQGAAKAKKNFADRFDGRAQELYTALRDQIAQAASGERASTAFTVTLEFTEAELGLPLAAGDEVTEALKQAVKTRIGTTFSEVYYALLRDCPYELYWHDKTTGAVAANSTYDIGDGSLTYSQTYYFDVAAGYRGSATFRFKSGGVTYTYVVEVDTSVGGTVREAAEKARRIVAEHADKSDLDKLTAYRDEIKALSDYNYAASDTGYGDPWQLIYVFDGDPDTKVVCEGFAKAFQYLCDMTRFDRYICCYSVTGTMNGAAHMWNLVTMDNGKNYLVDITNCKGSYLFLKGYDYRDGDVVETGDRQGETAKGYLLLQTSSTLLQYIYDAATRNTFSEEDLTLACQATDPYTAETVADPAPAPRALTVTFDPGEGTDLSFDTWVVGVGDTYGTLPTVTPPQDYTFAGWYTAAEGGVKVETSTTVTAQADHTLYAHWAETRTVTFDPNGGKASLTSKTAAAGLTYGALPTATRTGYTFAGWYTGRTDGTRITGSTVVTADYDHVLYAHWTARSYTVTLNANGGEVSPASLSVTYDAPYGTLPTPVREGYAFLGWFTEAEDGSQVTAEDTVKIVKAQTLYAHWAVIPTAVTTQPEDVTAAVGTNAVLRVQAVGAELSYQWQYRTSSSGAWKNSALSGARTDTLTVPLKADYHGYQYRCRVTGLDGTADSAEATLRIATRITAQPKSVTAAVGTKAVLQVTATGADLTYQWQYRTSGSGAWQNSTLSGAKAAKLTISLKAKHNGYQYRCRVTGAGGTVYSGAAAVKITASITAQPKDVTAAVGTKAVLRVTAAGADLTYQWQYRTGSGAWKNSTLSGARTAKLTIPLKAKHNGYQYRCKVTDANGTVCSDAATVKIATKITAQPKSVSGAAGTKKVLRVTATGVGLTYQWQYQTASGSWKNSVLSGARTAKLTIPLKARYDGARYRCKVTGANGTVYSRTVTLTVR